MYVFIISTFCGSYFLICFMILSQGHPSVFFFFLILKIMEPLLWEKLFWSPILEILFQFASNWVFLVYVFVCATFSFSSILAMFDRRSRWFVRVGKSHNLCNITFTRKEKKMNEHNVGSLYCIVWVANYSEDLCS